jgi:hypothetical protein
VGAVAYVVHGRAFPRATRAARARPSG